MDDMGKHEAFRHPSGAQMRRAAMWILASGVAAIAAIVSYSHIYALGRAHGGTGTAARLLPLSVDMLILVGELMLLHEADTKGRRFILGWVLVWSGILATLAANVTYGAQFGLEGAVIWGWPAYSFVLAAAGMVSVVKRTALMPVETGTEVAIPQAHVPDPVSPPAMPELPAPESAVSADTEGDTASRDTASPAFRRKTGTTARQPTRRKPARAASVSAIPNDVDTQAEALRILADNPDIDGSELGRQLGKTPGYGRTLKRKLAGSMAGPDSAQGPG